MPAAAPLALAPRRWTCACSWVRWHLQGRGGRASARQHAQSSGLSAAPHSQMARAHPPRARRPEPRAPNLRDPQSGAPLAIPPGTSLAALSPDLALRLLAPGAAPSTPAPPAADAARASALAAVTQLQALEAFLHGSCSLALASAVAASGQLPEKLTPVLGGLMQSLRREPGAALQRVGARALAELLLCCVQRAPCPNDKVLKNLAAMAAGDPAETPRASDPAWCARARAFVCVRVCTCV